MNMASRGWDWIEWTKGTMVGKWLNTVRDAKK